MSGVSLATINYSDSDTMIEISMKQLEQEHEPKYMICYWQVDSPMRYKRYCWNPIACKDFINSLGNKYTVKIYKLQ